MRNRLTGHEQEWLKHYLADIQKFDLLTAEEEVDLGKRIRASDDAALQQMVAANLRFVVKVARSYIGKGLPFEDLINEGNLGLIEAAKRFDESRGFRFVTIAVWWIRQSIKKALGKQINFVHRPQNQYQQSCRITEMYRRLSQQLRRTPTMDEVAEALQVPVCQLSRQMSSGSVALSLEAAPTDANAMALIDTLENPYVDTPDNGLDADSLHQRLEEILETLRPIEADVLRLAYGLESAPSLNTEEIAKKLLLTPEKVRKIRECAIRRMQHKRRCQLLRELL